MRPAIVGEPSSESEEVIFCMSEPREAGDGVIGGGGWDPARFRAFGIGMGVGGVINEVVVDVAKSVSRASWIAFTQLCTSPGVLAWR